MRDTGAVGEELRSHIHLRFQGQSEGMTKYTFRKRGTFKEEICIPLMEQKQMRYMHVIALFLLHCLHILFKTFMQKSRQVTLPSVVCLNRNLLVHCKLIACFVCVCVCVCVCAHTSVPVIVCYVTVFSARLAARMELHPPNKRQPSCR